MEFFCQHLCAEGRFNKHRAKCHVNWKTKKTRRSVSLVFVRPPRETWICSELSPTLSPKPSCLLDKHVLYRQDVGVLQHPNLILQNKQHVRSAGTKHHIVTQLCRRHRPLPLALMHSTTETNFKNRQKNPPTIKRLSRGLVIYRRRGAS